MYTALLGLHFLGLALGLGAGFAQLTLGFAGRDLPPAERAQFALRVFALGKNGSIGLALLLLTGIAMLIMRGVGATFAQGGGAFHAKLTLVAATIGVFGYTQVLMARARRAGGGPALASLPTVARVKLALDVAIVICATIAFH